MRSSFSCCGIEYNASAEMPDARVSQSDISALYDKIAWVYDIWGKLTESSARNRAIELAKIKDGQKILEVAVGTGLAFSELVKRNPHGKNVGIDLSHGMLEKARKRLKKLSNTNYTLDIGSAFNIPVTSGSINTLMNNYMFDLIPYEDMDKILSEFARVLIKGGRLVLVNMTKGERFGSGLYDVLYRLSPTTMGGCRGVRMSDLLKQRGFIVESREYYQQLLFPSEVIVAYKP